MRYLVFLITIWLCKPVYAQVTYDHIVTAGVYLHWNVHSQRSGIQKGRIWGFEVAYWQFKEDEGTDTQWGMDVGVELSKKGSPKIYFEYQPFLFYASASIGPVLYVKENGIGSIGLQGTIWGGAFALLNWRYRRLAGENVVNAGVMAKVPVYIQINGPIM